MIDLLVPDRTKFNQDPAGYAALAWTRWAILQDMHGVHIDPECPPSPEDLKSPVLWLTHAQALTQAAVTLYRAQPSFDTMPGGLRAICDSQYCAVVMMVIGYSLEVALKAMTIMRLGITEFMARERKFRTHELSDLADFIPNLSEKDHAILKVLTHFVKWAGRYPDPGTREHAHQEDVFKISETHQISARDLFQLAGHVMNHVRTVIPTD